MADVFKQQVIKRFHVFVLRGGHFIEHIRMAADRALAEDHHATGQDVCALNGDSNRRALISTGEEVTFAEHNAFTACDIHCINN